MHAAAAALNREIGANAPARGVQVVGQVLLYQRGVVDMHQQARCAAQRGLHSQQFAHQRQNGLGLGGQRLAHHLARDVQRQRQQIIGHFAFGGAQGGWQRKQQGVQRLRLLARFFQAGGVALGLTLGQALAVPFAMTGLLCLLSQMNDFGLIEQHGRLRRVSACPGAGVWPCLDRCGRDRRHFPALPGAHQRRRHALYRLGGKLVRHRRPVRSRQP